MSINFQIGDLISRINVSFIGNKVDVKVVNTKNNIAILNFFIKKNLIENYLILSNKQILIYLRTLKNNGYMFKKMEIISKPSKRIYFRYNTNNLNIKYKKYSIILLSTTKGLITLQEALYYKIGGEVILGVKK